MKKNFTAAELAALTGALRDVFETVEATPPLENEAEADGLCLSYEQALDDVGVVITRRVWVDGEPRALRMRGLLSSAAPGVSARELQLHHDDMIRDFLTGAYNRAFWDTRIRARLEGCAAAGRTAAVALVKVDRFDAIVEQYGGDDTDQLICYVANLWKRYYDENEEKVVCRMSDHTFAVVCLGADELDLESQIRFIYEKMDLVCASTNGMFRRIPFTLSMACAGLDEVPDKSAAGLYKLCSRRLAAVSVAGGNAVYQVTRE